MAISSTVIRTSIRSLSILTAGERAANDRGLSTSMIFTSLHLDGVFRIEPQLITDDRGAFARRFCVDEFRAHGLESDLVQRSVSINARAGTIRGMHFQIAPYLETKVVRCTRGAIFDVLVD